MRNQVRAEVASVRPLDTFEAATKQSVLDWIDSGVELCRIEKPATPGKHLVAYFPVIDGDYLLLVDHINAELWLPTGGHVEPGEHPRETAIREVKEELSIAAEFIGQNPVLVTSTETVGKTAGHTDVSIWYALRGDRNEKLAYDKSEFHSVRWFHKDALPYDRTDPELKRFVRKFYDNLP